jgi:hypothetical protein
MSRSVSNEHRRSFIDAFGGGGLARTDCACGTTFFNNEDEDLDWDPGELEGLRERAQKQDGKTIGLEGSVGTIILDGVEYVSQCSCWHELGDAKIRELDRKKYQVAQYYAYEKQRLQKKADAVPVIATE